MTAKKEKEEVKKIEVDFGILEKMSLGELEKLEARIPEDIDPWVVSRSAKRLCILMACNPEMTWDEAKEFNLIKMAKAAK